MLLAIAGRRYVMMNINGRIKPIRNQLSSASNLAAVWHVPNLTLYVPNLTGSSTWLCQLGRLNLLLDLVLLDMNFLYITKRPQGIFDLKFSIPSNIYKKMIC